MDHYSKLDESDSDSDVETGHKETKEEELDNVCQPHPSKWWQVIRIISYFMLLISAAILFCWTFVYIIFLIRPSHDPNEIVIAGKWVRCSLGSTVYFLIILAKDVTRVCRILVRETCRNVVCITKVVCVLLAIVTSLTWLMFAIVGQD